MTITSFFLHYTDKDHKERLVIFHYYFQLSVTDKSRMPCVRKTLDIHTSHKYGTSAFLEKYARPEKRKIRNTQTKASPTTVKSTSAKRLVSTKFQDLTQAEKRKRAVNVLLMKDKIETPKAIQRKSNITNAEKNDGPHTPNGMQWRDKGYFFNEIAMWSDVCQNNIGDCYFLAALCSVAYVNPFYIQNKTAMRFLSTGNNTGSKQPDTLSLPRSCPLPATTFLQQSR